MRALILLLALVAPVMAQEHDHSGHAVPAGKGADADGSAWLRITVTGLYTIHNAEVVGQPKNPMHLVAGSVWLVKPHKDALVWTNAAGKKEVVPAENLISTTPVGSGK